MRYSWCLRQKWGTSVKRDLESIPSAKWFKEIVIGIGIIGNNHRGTRYKDVQSRINYQWNCETWGQGHPYEKLTWEIGCRRHWPAIQPATACFSVASSTWDISVFIWLSKSAISEEIRAAKCHWTSLDNCLCQLPPTTHSGETDVARACKAVGQFCPTNNNFTIFRWFDFDGRSQISILNHFDRSRGGFSNVSLILQVPTMTGAAAAPTH